ncbi:hypothetical protein [Oricola sp.]|uniref:hypothetical protein n=1 Tax=Oricola sp. TaxID=1979950 RepID=UPI003BAC243F
MGKRAIAAVLLLWLAASPAIANERAAIVCYMFVDNEHTTREVFTFSGQKIAVSEQDRIAESCDAF